MPSTIEQHYIDEFDDNVMHLAQQKGSKFRGKIKEKPLKANECTFEQLNAIEAVEIQSRHADTVIQEREHIRRWVGARDFSVAELYDWPDEFRTAVALDSAYVQGQSYAYGRKLDDLVIAAFSATAKTGRDGGSTVTWSTTDFDGSNWDVDRLRILHTYEEMGQLSSTGTGMSLLKLRAIKRILGQRDVDLDDQRLYLALGPAQVQDLLADPNLTTVDRMNMKAYEAGDIDGFYGFTFIKTSRLGVNSNSHRRCWAFTENSMGMAVGKDLTSRMDERSDKNHSLQIASYFSANATRLDETEIIEVECEEAPATS